MKRRQGPCFISIGLQKTAANWLFFNLNQHRGVKSFFNTVLKIKADDSKSARSVEAFISQYVNYSNRVLPDNDPTFVSRLIKTHQAGTEELTKEVESKVPTRWLQLYQGFNLTHSVGN